MAPGSVRWPSIASSVPSETFPNRVRFRGRMSEAGGFLCLRMPCELSVVCETRAPGPVSPAPRAVRSSPAAGCSSSWTTCRQQDPGDPALGRAGERGAVLHAGERILFRPRLLGLRRKCRAHQACADDGQADDQHTPMIASADGTPSEMSSISHLPDDSEPGAAHHHHPGRRHPPPAVAKALAYLAGRAVPMVISRTFGSVGVPDGMVWADAAGGLDGGLTCRACAPLARREGRSR
jgi:hypothetical protein